MAPLIEMIRNNDTFESYRWGFADSVSVGASRDELVAGAYMPSAATTGPLPGVIFVDREADSSGYIHVLQSDGIYDADLDKYVINGVRFWGQVRPVEPKLLLRNCQFHGFGPDTALWTSAMSNSDVGGLFKVHGSGYYHVVVENSLFDPLPWVTERGYAATLGAGDRPHIGGGTGYDVELRWCRIRNVTDGWGINDDTILASDPGNPRPDGHRFGIFDRCLFEQGAYVNGPDYQTIPYAQSGGYTHNDGIQFVRGRHILIRGCMIGGTMTPSAYQTWGTDWNPGATNDYANAGIMLQQDGGIVAPGTPSYLTDVVIEDNFIGGGMASINVNNKYENDLSGVTIRRNKFFVREDDWGVAQNDGVLTNTNGGYGYYVVKGADTNPTWQDNARIDDVPLPFVTQ